MHVPVHRLLATFFSPSSIKVSLYTALAFLDRHLGLSQSAAMSLGLLLL